MSRKFIALVSTVYFSGICISGFAMPWKAREDRAQVELTFDALFAKRTGGENREFAGECMCTLFFDQMGSRSLMKKFGWEPGAKLTASLCMDEQNSLEAAVAWVNQWSSHKKTSSSDSTLRYPFDDNTYTQDYFKASSAYASYRSHLWDGELNYWRHMTPRGMDYFSVSTILGLRGFYIGERLRLHFVKPPNKSTYWVMAKDRLLGVQTGLNLQINPGSKNWSWDIDAKGGILANWAWDKNWLGDRNNTVVLRSHHGSKVLASYMIDLGAQLGYHVGRHFTIHGGYSFLGLWSVATAAMQFTTHTNKGSGRNISTGEAVYYQFFNLGLDFVF